MNDHILSLAQTLYDRPQKWIPIIADPLDCSLTESEVNLLLSLAVNTDAELVAAHRQTLHKLSDKRYVRLERAFSSTDTGAVDITLRGYVAALRLANLITYEPDTQIEQLSMDDPRLAVLKYPPHR